MSTVRKDHVRKEGLSTTRAEAAAPARNPRRSMWCRVMGRPRGSGPVSGDSGDEDELGIVEECPGQVLGPLPPIHGKGRRRRIAKRGDLGQSMHTYDKAGATVIRGMVLKSEGNPVVSAVKGGKQYSVLFFGASTPVLVEERWLRRSK